MIKIKSSSLIKTIIQITCFLYFITMNINPAKGASIFPPQPSAQPQATTRRAGASLLTLRTNAGSTIPASAAPRRISPRLLTTRPQNSNPSGGIASSYPYSLPSSASQTSGGSAPNSNIFTLSNQQSTPTPISTPPPISTPRPRIRASATSPVTTDNGQVITKVYHFSRPQVLKNERGSYYRVRMMGLPNMSDIDLPRLPFSPVTLLLPYNTRVQKVDIGYDKGVPLQGKAIPLGRYSVEPGAEPVSNASGEMEARINDLKKAIMEDRIKKQETEQKSEMENSRPNQALLSQMERFPTQINSVPSVQRKGNYNLLVLNLYPVVYAPNRSRYEGELSYYDQITVSVTLSPANDSLRPNGARDGDIVQRMVDNPEVMNTYPASAGSSVRSSAIFNRTAQAISLPGTGVNYVIITSQSILDAFKRLQEMAHAPLEGFEDLQAVKFSQGITSAIVTVEDINTDYPGIDLQEKIRNFIIDAYTNRGLQYVLLAGDNTLVPARKFHVVAYSTATYSYQTDMPVDMYYACLDGTFDGNGNGIYGEPTDGVNGGDVDLLAEVYVGRIPINLSSLTDLIAKYGDPTINPTTIDPTNNDLSNFVHKTIAYINTPATDPYLRNAYVVAECMGPAFNDITQTVEMFYAAPYMEEIRWGASTWGYTSAGLSPTYNTLTLYDEPPAIWSWYTEDVVNIINNQQPHIFNHLGHATPSDNMRLYKFQWYWPPPLDITISIDDLVKLNNTKYFFHYSQGCCSGGFDKPHCFAEELTTLKHGAFATIMNVSSGWFTDEDTWGPSQHFNRMFWDFILAKGVTELGKANQLAKEDHINVINLPAFRWIYYELTLFGDPQVGIKR